MSCAHCGTEETPLVELGTEAVCANCACSALGLCVDCEERHCVCDEGPVDPDCLGRGPEARML